MIGITDEHEAARAEQRTGGHRHVAAEAIDRMSDEWCDQAGDQQRHEKPPGERDRPAALGSISGTISTGV